MIDLSLISGRMNLKPLHIKWLSALIGLLVFIGIILSLNAGAARRLKNLQNEAASFSKARAEYEKDRTGLAPFDSKLLAPEMTAAEAVQEAASRAGIKKNLSALKPFIEPASKGFRRSGVEVRVEGITQNELLNLIYRIEDHQNLLLIKDFVLKARFGSSGLNDVTLQIVLVTRDNG